MKNIIIIAGSRNVAENAENYQQLEQIVDFYIQGLSDVVIVSGGCRGIDRLGEHYAIKHHLECWRCPADWKKYGKKAGPMRNAKMAAIATHLIAFPSPTSRGTIDMINKANDKGLAVRVKTLV